jgi:serine/threonine protein kinase
MQNAEFVTSTPAEASDRAGHSIKKEAFSPNYFQRFFTEEKELGRGGKGVVLLVRHELDGVSLGHFACKRVPVGNNHVWLEKVLIEVQLLQRLSHPNLVSYRHVWLEDVKLNRFGPTVPCAFILQQYCNSGDLLHYVVGSGRVAATNEDLKEQMRRRSKGHSERPRDLRSSHRVLAFEEIYSFFKDIASGLAHLHEANYIHRDLKPSNCLLNKAGSDLRCLISDFGEVQAENVVRKSTGSTGTISYCAPEVLRMDASGKYGNFTTKSDIFSLGMILYFMCFGRLPYLSTENIEEEFEDLDQLRAEISTWTGFREEKQERPDLPDQLYSFLKRLLAVDPVDRPSASEILQAISTNSGLKTENLSRNGRVGSGLGGSKGSPRIQPVESPVPGTPASGRESSHYEVEMPTKRITGSRRVTSAAYSEDAVDEVMSSETPNHPILIRKSSSQPPTPAPLLLPPTMTRRGRAKVWLTVQQHQFHQWVHLNQYFLNLAMKFAIFVIKVISLTKPCLPIATSTLLAYPLICLAAIDLGFRTPMQVSIVLFAVHGIIVGIAAQKGALCAERIVDHWHWDDA